MRSPGGMSEAASGESGESAGAVFTAATVDSSSAALIMIIDEVVEIFWKRVKNELVPVNYVMSGR